MAIAAVRRREGATTHRGGLRGFVGRAGDAELFQSAAEGVGMKTEDGGRAARTVNDPLRLAEDCEDVVLLNVFQGGGRLAGGFGTGLAEDVGIDLERRAQSRE